MCYQMFLIDFLTFIRINSIEFSRNNFYKKLREIRKLREYYIIQNEIPKKFKLSRVDTNSYNIFAKARICRFCSNK